MCHCSPEDHARAEDDQGPAVADGGLAVCGGTEAVVVGEDLDEDGAEFAKGGADAVTGCAVAGGEYFGGDYVGCCIGACAGVSLVFGWRWMRGDEGRTKVEEDLAEDVQDNGDGALSLCGDEDCPQGDEVSGQREKRVLLETNTVQSMNDEY